MANIFCGCWKKRFTSVATNPGLPRILITGASGQVGGELLRTLTPFGEIVAPTRAELNLSDTASIQACIRGVRPRWIVNAGAYTAVDKAELEPALAFAINTEVRHWGRAPERAVASPPRNYKGVIGTIFALRTTGTLVLIKIGRAHV